MKFVIAYDIEDDRVRTKISDLLERYGWRVQKSVFECVIEDDDALQSLTAALEDRLPPTDHGSIRVYRLCESCHKASFGLGAVARGAGGEPWIVV